MVLSAVFNQLYGAIHFFFYSALPFKLLCAIKLLASFPLCLHCSVASALYDCVFHRRERKKKVCFFIHSDDLEWHSVNSVKVIVFFVSSKIFRKSFGVVVSACNWSVSLYIFSVRQKSFLNPEFEFRWHFAHFASVDISFLMRCDPILSDPIQSNPSPCWILN